MPLHPEAVLYGHPRLCVRRAHRVADRLPRDGDGGRCGLRGGGPRAGSEPPLRFVTASLKVDHLRPTPLSIELELRARATEIKEHKVALAVTLAAGGEVCARGEVVCVQMPERFGAA